MNSIETDCFDFPCFNDLPSENKTRILTDLRLFYFKKHVFKKHKAQNAKKLRNMQET